MICSIIALGEYSIIVYVHKRKSNIVGYISLTLCAILIAAAELKLIKAGTKDGIHDWNILSKIKLFLLF